MAIYYLDENYISGSRMEISEREYLAVVMAHQSLITLKSVSDSYDIVLAAIKDLEKFLLTSTVDIIYSHRPGTDTFTRAIDELQPEVNVRLVTFLTASNMLIETLKRAESKLRKLGFDTPEIKPVLSTTFDQSFAYRVMCALRNYTIHHSLPLGRNSIAMRRQEGEMTSDKVGPSSRLRYTLSPMISVEDFCASDVREKTRTEVQATGAKYLDIKYLMRQYFDDVSSCYATFVDFHREPATKSVAAISDMYEKFEAQFNRKGKFLRLYSSNSNGDIESTPVNPDFWQRQSERILLPPPLGKRLIQYVSSEVLRSEDSFPQEDKNLYLND